MRAFEEPLTRAVRDSNNRGTLKFSAGYFESQDLKSGSMKAPAGTTIKMKVGGPAAPLVEDGNSEQRAGHCERQRSDTYILSLKFTFVLQMLIVSERP